MLSFTQHKGGFTVYKYVLFVASLLLAVAAFAGDVKRDELGLGGNDGNDPATIHLRSQFTNPPTKATRVHLKLPDDGVLSDIGKLADTVLNHRFGNGSRVKISSFRFRVRQLPDGSYDRHGHPVRTDRVVQIRIKFFFK